MGFGNKTAKTPTKTQKDYSGYRTIGSIWKSKFNTGQFTCFINNKDRQTKDGKTIKAEGQLLFKDTNTGNVYRVNSIYLNAPSKEIDGLEFNLKVDLNNDNCTTLIEEGEGSASTGGNDEADLDSDGYSVEEDS